MDIFAIAEALKHHIQNNSEPQLSAKVLIKLESLLGRTKVQRVFNCEIIESVQ